MLSAGTNIEWLRDDLQLIDTPEQSHEVAQGCASADGVVYVPALLGLGTRVGTVGIELTEQIVHLGDTRDQRHAGAPLTAHRIALEVPRDMLADVSTRVLFALQKFREEFGVTPQRVPHVTQRGRHRRCVNLFTGTTAHGHLEIRDQPGATEAAAPHHHAITARLVHHAHGVVARPNVTIAQDGHVRDGRLELGNRIPIGLAAVKLARGSTVESE
jgi:hypothetical protein